MKGVIFTEFMGMVEEKWGLELVNKLIKDAADPLNGVYVSAGNYDHMNLVRMVVALHKHSVIPLPTLLKTYGQFVFKRLINTYKHLNFPFDNCFDFLENIESVIHREVKKLDLNTHPPKFETIRLEENSLKMVYMSHRCMGPVAEGLILGCAEYFEEEIQLEVLSQSDAGDRVEFLLTKES